MKRENISDAMDMLDEDLLLEAAQSRSGSTKKRRFPKLAVIAAAVAVVVGGTATIAAVGGHFVDIKNIFGTVTDTQYVDATEDIRITALSNKNGGLDIGIQIVDPTKAPYNSLGVIKPLSYSISDKDGKIVAVSEKWAEEHVGSEDYDIIKEIEKLNETYEELVAEFQKLINEYQSKVSIEIKDNSADSKATTKLFSEMYGSETFVLHIESLVGESKADQPLEIFGDWKVEFTVNGAANKPEAQSPLKVQFLSAENGGLKIDANPSEEAKETYGEISSLRAVTFHIDDENGKQVCSFSFNDVGHVDTISIDVTNLYENSESAANEADDLIRKISLRFSLDDPIFKCVVTISDENGKAVLKIGEEDILADRSQLIDEAQGSIYKLHIDSFIGESDKSGPVEILGDWTTELFI